MVKTLRLSNYRSIEGLEIHLSPLCVLVGENDVGKTNILRALKTVLGKDWLSVRDFVAEDYYRHEADRDICIEVDLDPPLEYRGFATEAPAPVSRLRYTLTRYKKATKGARKGDSRLLQECLGGDGKALMVLREAPKKGEPRSASFSKHLSKRRFPCYALTHSFNWKR